MIFGMLEDDLLVICEHSENKKIWQCLGNLPAMLWQCSAICVMIYPGFLDLRLYDRMYENEMEIQETSDAEKILVLLHDGPKSVKELQAATTYGSRSRFLEEVINPLIESGKIYRDGSSKSPTAVLKIKN